VDKHALVCKTLLGISGKLSPIKLRRKKYKGLSRLWLEFTKVVLVCVTEQIAFDIFSLNGVSRPSANPCLQTLFEIGKLRMQV
jgi:hypothetical protein